MASSTDSWTVSREEELFDQLAAIDHTQIRLDDDDVETLPVVCSGPLKFACVDGASSGELDVRRGYRPTAAAPRGHGKLSPGEAGVWCELIADVDTGEVRLAVFAPGVGSTREHGPDDAVELIALHWNTKVHPVRRTADNVNYFMITYCFSIVADARFDGGGGVDGARRRVTKRSLVDSAAVVAPTADKLAEWHNKLVYAQQLIGEPFHTGALYKLPLHRPNASAKHYKKRFHVLDGAAIVYYDSPKLGKLMGKISIQENSTVFQEEVRGCALLLLLLIDWRAARLCCCCCCCCWWWWWWWTLGNSANSTSSSIY